LLAGAKHNNVTLTKLPLAFDDGAGVTQRPHRLTIHKDDGAARIARAQVYALLPPPGAVLAWLEDSGKDLLAIDRHLEPTWLGNLD
jgi:hypothetical protein